MDMCLKLFQKKVETTYASAIFKNSILKMLQNHYLFNNNLIFESTLFIYKGHSMAALLRE